MAITKKINTESPNRACYLKSPIIQYGISLIVNVAFVIILLSMNSSCRNLQLPEGAYRNNIQKGQDTVGYVYFARNYLKWGVFGCENVPDCHRTIGYPFFLAMLMKLFGSNWLIAAFFLQAFFYASIIPVLSKIANILFPDRPSLATPIFCFLLISGIYLAQVPMLLTDTFFAALFTIGLYFGFLSIIRQSWKYLILQLVFISCAAEVRPNLIYFAFINVFILWLIAKRHNALSDAKIKKIIITSSAILLLTCDIPSIRNYVHYSFFKPSDVFEVNLFNYLAKEVMIKQNKVNVFEEMAEKVKKAGDIRERMSLETKFTLEVCKKYPETVASTLLEHAQSVLFLVPWVDMGTYWGYYWHDIAKITPQSPLKKSEFLYVATAIWFVVYAVVYTLFLLFLLHLVREKDWLFLFTILIFIGYFAAPAFVAGGGSRMRIAVEGIIVMCAFYEAGRIKLFVSSKTVWEQ